MAKVGAVKGAARARVVVMDTAGAAREMVGAEMETVEAEMVEVETAVEAAMAMEAAIVAGGSAETEVMAAEAADSQTPTERTGENSRLGRPHSLQRAQGPR